MSDLPVLRTRFEKHALWRWIAGRASTRASMRSGYVTRPRLRNPQDARMNQQSDVLEHSERNAETQRQPWHVAQRLTAAAANSAETSAPDVVPSDHEDFEADEDGGHKPGPRATRNLALRRLVGERITEARRLNGVDQSSFATELLGCANPTQPSLWEQGKRLPPLHALIDISRVLGVSLDFLVGEADDWEGLGARGAVVRRVERLLKFNAETVAECLLKACSSGADALRVAKFATRAAALCDSADRFEELNGKLFENARGGATLKRTSAEMRDALKSVERFLARANYSRAHALEQARDRIRGRIEAQ